MKNGGGDVKSKEKTTQHGTGAGFRVKTGMSSNPTNGGGINRATKGKKD